MKRAAEIAQSQKIYNCVDQLLMQDVEYQFELDKKQQELQNSNFKRNNNRQPTNVTVKSSIRGNKSLISPDRRSNASLKKTMKNLHDSNQANKVQKSPKVRFPDHKINILNQKGDTSLSGQDLKINQSLKLKRTVSCDPNRLQQIKENDLQLDVSNESDNSFIGTRDGSPTGLLSPGSRMTNMRQNRLKLKHSSPTLENNIGSRGTTQNRRKKLSDFSKSLTQSVNRFSESPSYYPQTNKTTPEPSLPQPLSPQFHLTHDELQFLSLLYPNQTPEQLMIKLLTYYEQQVQYKNSFQEIAFREQKKKKNYFFKSNADLSKSINDKIKQSQGQGDKSERGSDKDVSIGNNGQTFLRLPVEKCINADAKEQTLNEYTRLKQQCLAALGSQMVQTQIKSSIVETANVNYYTRQYAMPLIQQVIEEKNQEAEAKLQKLHCGAIKYQLGNSANLPVTEQALPSAYTSSNFPEEYIHKVYIPANSRGQCFEMDYEPRAKLFDYLSENEYKRILRDINHLIQKVLLYHRHNSFLKKKNNSLLKGWNLVLVVLLVSILCLLYIESFFAFQKKSSYIEIVSFFSLSFLLILIMGNAFNNYKKSIKRSSLIKDICEEITNYLEFANCSSKNIKWVLGKDFFWLEIWIYLKRDHSINHAKR